MIESPSETIISLIRAEHKNYILFILPFVALKFSLLANLSIIHLYQISLSFNAIFTGIVLFPLIFIFLSFLLTQLAKVTSLKPRFRDIIAVLSYALIPIALSAIILSTLELAVFGLSLFELSPSPFFLKPLFSWLFVVLEAGMLVWAMVLCGKALGRFFPLSLAMFLTLLVPGSIAGIALVINPYLF